MHYAQLLIKEPEPCSCFNILPDIIKDNMSDLEVEVIQCTRLSEDGGHALIKITDRGRILSNEIMESMTYSSEDEACTIDRISGRRMMAMVMNRRCKAPKLFSDSRCFITSATMGDDGNIKCTVIGPDSNCIKKLRKDIAEQGFTVKREITGMAGFSLMLSEEQEDAVRAAAEHGYYDIPRKVNMDDLSKIKGCTKSTFNIKLRNAERKIMLRHIMQNKGSTSKKR
jgi:predicted DNA binding protein